MLQIRNVCFTLKKDLRTLLEDCSFTLNTGDKAVIIGEEGNGKSTLLKWICDPQQIEDYIEAQGKRVFSGERLGYLPQELPAEYKEQTVLEFFAQEEAFFDLPYDSLRRLAGQLGMEPEFFYSDRKMKTLSGGERVKVQMLRILALQPTVLLLDEPSNDIDIATLEWLENLIREWRGIVLFISHDETLIERTANVVVHLEQLRHKQVSRCGVFRMPYAQYVESRAHGIERQQQKAVWEKREKQIRDEKFRRIAQSVERAQANISRGDPHGGRLLKKKMHAVKSMEKRFAREDETRTQMPDYETMIDMKLNPAVSAVPAGKVVVDFSLERLVTPDGQRLLSKDIHFVLRGSEKVCITGANGAGKTTLLRKISAQLLARGDIRAGWMPQNYEEELDLSETPVEFLAPDGSREERTRIRTFLGALKYTTQEMEHTAAELSGGQKAKILLLKLILSGCNVLILDEPTRNFSPLSGFAIRDLLRRFPGAIISISHDRKYISEVCDAAYELTETGLNPVDWM